MDIKSISTQLELVQECYHKVLSAKNFWTAYRRAAGECGVATRELPQFVPLLTDLTRTAEELDRKREAAKNALYGVGILQVEVTSADGTRVRKVVVSRPTDKIDEPHVSRAAYHALTQMLGDGLRTTAPFDVAVVDDFGHVSPDHRINGR
ncbi:MAG: hypothetical protein II649_06975 [Kiritimatiellae bacterium]|nr:hypothetical protein [Kiritimatiellia bacterium]